MSSIILDIGSGKSLPDFDTAKRVIDSVAEIDTHRNEVVFKAQLFKDAPPNIPLNPNVYKAAYIHASDLGYKLTASVFDKFSLLTLLDFDPCFVKIACRPELYWLIGEVPRRIPVYVSYSGGLVNLEWSHGVTWLFCVPEYPASKKPYLMAGPTKLSDHSEGLEVYRTLKPKIWECHYCLKHDPDNPDAGSFAKTPAELAEIL